MAARRCELVLELHPGQVFHFLNYLPPVRGIVGSVVTLAREDRSTASATRNSAGFMLRTGTFSLTDAMCQVVLAFNDRKADQILNLLDSPSREWLVTYAKDIPSSDAERRVRQFSFINSNGERQVPDQNLAAIRRYFGA